MNKKFKRHAIKQGIRARHRVKRLQQHPFLIPIVTFFGLFLITGIAFVFLYGHGADANNSRVVQLFVDGKTRIIPTHSTTVGELLQRLNVELNNQDVVEPAQDAQITEDNFKVNVYRARPVTIIDNGKKISTLTAQSEPREVAQKAGVSIYPEDTIQAVSNDDISEDEVLGQKVVIERAKPIDINLYGNNIQIRTHAKTVAEVLTEKDIKTIDGDVVSPEPSTELTNITQIFVLRQGKKVIIAEEVVPAPVKFDEDPTLSVGTSVVRQPGSSGKKIVTYELRFENNKEVERKQLQAVVSIEPVPRIVARGAKVVFSNPSANVELGRKIAAELGVSDQFSCVYNVFEHESKWNATAHNARSGAHGIPQALPGSKMGPGWESDPNVQIRWGINYMIKRYGGPCAAWHHWQGAHSY